MLQKYDIFRGFTKWEVLQPFFADPLSWMGLREISRSSSLSTTAVKLHLDRLVKGALLVKRMAEKPGLKKKQPLYAANRDNEVFRYLKKINNINLLNSKGVLQYLSANCQPDAIILFGSASRGEDVKESDIDLYLQCGEKGLDLNRFESALGRKVQLHFYSDFSKISPELKNNIINGIILSGYLKVF